MEKHATWTPFGPESISELASLFNHIAFPPCKKQKHWTPFGVESIFDLELLFQSIPFKQQKKRPRREQIIGIKRKTPNSVYEIENLNNKLNEQQHSPDTKDIGDNTQGSDPNAMNNLSN